MKGEVGGGWCGYVVVLGLKKECLVVARRGHESADVEMGESSV
jgi:hypothetical protein